MVSMRFPKVLRRGFMKHQYLITAICFLLCVETLLHINSFEVKRPPKPLDEPFSVRCQEPDVHARRENAAIVMLARNRELQGAITAVSSLERQFNRWFHYPIIFLNDEPWDQDFIDTLSKIASGKIQFETIPPEMWGFPAWMDQAEARRVMKQQEARGVMYAGMESYHHMCRFNSGKFYDHEALRPYKWYWRLEPDVEFTCAITYDPFAAMARAGKKYGYTMALWELGQTVPSMFRKVSDYKKAHRIPSTGLWNAMMEPSWAPLPLRPLMSWLSSRDASGDAWNLCHFWSNFEIADMDWFRSREYRKFFEFLDADGGFYYERWGDAPIHSLAAALFLKPEQLHHFEDFGYSHAPFHSCPSNAAGGQLPESSLLGASPWDEEKRNGIGCRCTCKPGGLGPRPFCLNHLKQTVR